MDDKELEMDDLFGDAGTLDGPLDVPMDVPLDVPLVEDVPLSLPLQSIPLEGLAQHLDSLHRSSAEQ